MITKITMIWILSSNYDLWNQFIIEIANQIMIIRNESWLLQWNYYKYYDKIMVAIIASKIFWLSWLLKSNQDYKGCIIHMHILMILYSNKSIFLLTSATFDILCLVNLI